MSQNAATVPEPSDIELMQQVAREDQDALMTLYERYGSYVYGLALRVLQHSALAEEAVQDTFLKVWRRSVSWDPSKGQLSSWLLTIARHTAIDLWRRERRQMASSSEPLELTLELQNHPANADNAHWFEGQVLRQLLTRIPPEQALVIQLAFFQGMTHSQMADYLGWPLGTVKTRTRSGLEKLRALWQEAMADQS